MSTPLDDLADALDRLDGKQVHLTVHRYDWGTLERVGSAPSGPIDIGDLTERVSRELIRRANREGAI